MKSKTPRSHERISFFSILYNCLYEYFQILLMENIFSSYLKYDISRKKSWVSYCWVVKVTNFENVAFKTSGKSFKYYFNQITYTCGSPLVCLLVLCSGSNFTKTGKVKSPGDLPSYKCMPTVKLYCSRRFETMWTVFNLF